MNSHLILENITTEVDDETEIEMEEAESIETPSAPSLLSKVANFFNGGDDTEDDNEDSVQVSDHNETDTESLNEKSKENLEDEENTVQNDTNQMALGTGLPKESENYISPAEFTHVSTTEEQEDDKKPKTLVKAAETTTSVPEIDEIRAPSVEDIIVTTPAPLAKLEEDIQKTVEKLPEPETQNFVDNLTNLMFNETEKSLGIPEFKPIPVSTPKISNSTKEEVAPESPSDSQITEAVHKQENIMTKVPGTANVISTPPPLLGLMKSQILNDSDKKNTKSEAPVKLNQPEKKKEEEVKSEIMEEKLEENNEILADEPSQTENSRESVEKNDENFSDKEFLKEKTSELEKVIEKLGVAKETSDETELVFKEQEKDEQSEETKQAEDLLHQAKDEETTEKYEKSLETDKIKHEAISLGIDTYGNPPPPMKSLEEPSTIPTEDTIKIDNKIDLHQESIEKDVNPSLDIPPPIQNQPEQIPEEKAEQNPDDLKLKDQDFHQKREAIKSLLESEAPKHGSEIDSSEVKQPEMTSKVKQGIPSIIEIRRNGKILTPKEGPVNTNEINHESSK